MRTRLRGVGVSRGMAIGEVRRMGQPLPEPPPDQLGPRDAPERRARANAAFEAVAAELLARGERAGGEARAVLRAQAMMARDPELMAEVARRIDAGSSAQRAVHDAMGGYRALLAAAGGRSADRVRDLDDVRDRLIAHITGVPMPGLPVSDAPYVLVARDLAPADTALLDVSRVLGLVTEEGSPTSHSAILARALGVPAVVALPAAAELTDGTVVAVDGGSGEVVVHPTERERAALARTARGRATRPAGGNAPGATLDGHPVPLLANVGGVADVAAAVEAGAEGVGLFRTELLFLRGAGRVPSLSEQSEAYRGVLAAFPEGRVTVRLFDAGADKPLPYLAPGQEPNPALGVRGLRALLAQPEVLDGQLRALAHAAEGLPAHLEVMAPMVADRADARAFTDACRAAGLPARAGAMVEIPAAAVRARSLLREVEFLSVGTNDLVQYAFAADRQLAAVSRLQNPWQPALLDLVAMAAEAATAEGKSCGVCGEAAADPLLACVLTGLGVTSLSMAAAALSQVRAALAGHTLAQCERAAAAARAADDADGARAAAGAVLAAP